MRFWLLILAVNAACKPVERLDAEIPSDIAWYAVVSRSESSIEASELTPRDPDAPLIVVDRAGTETLVLGWTNDPAFQREALRSPAPCEPTLPTPSMVLRWGEELEPLDPDGAPPLTSDGFAAGCPELDPIALSADLSCSSERCRLAIERTGPCTFTLDTSACGGPAFRSGLDRSGRLCANAIEPWSCDGSACASPETSCAVDLYTAVDPPFVSETLDLPGEPYSPAWLRMYGQLRAEGRLVGSATDLIELNDQLVAYSAGRPLEGCSDDTPDGSFVFIDPERLAITRTATAPPCIYRMLAVEDRFAAVHRDGESLAISLFDSAGRRTDTALTPLVYWLDRTLAMLLAGDRIHVLSGGAQNALTDYDRISLALGRSKDLGSSRIWSMAPADASRLALLEASPPAVSWLDLSSGDQMRYVLPWPATAHDYDTTFDGAFDPIAGRMIVTGSRPPAAYALEPFGISLARSVIHDSDAEPIAIAPGPAEGQMLVASSLLEASGERSVVLSIYEVGRARFLPGSHRIGPTFASKLIRTAPDRYFVLLPWTPAIVRITLSR